MISCDISHSLVPGLAILSSYFVQKRGLVMAIAVSGCNVGAVRILALPKGEVPFGTRIASLSRHLHRG